MDRSNDAAFIAQLLGAPRTIAMVGASDNPARPSYGVFQAMQAAGHDVLPVTPAYETVCGVAAVPNLAAARQHWGKAPDIVDVFRAPDALPGVVEEAKAIGAPLVWGQLGVVHEDAQAAAVAAGMDIIVDRCLAIEQRRV